MVTLVANHFLQASGMASTGPLLNALDLSLGVLERLAQRARVALVRALDLPLGAYRSMRVTELRCRDSTD